MVRLEGFLWQELSVILADGGSGVLLCRGTECKQNDGEPNSSEPRGALSAMKAPHSRQNTLSTRGSM